MNLLVQFCWHIEKLFQTKADGLVDVQRRNKIWSELDDTQCW
jgi:hypothetical protein